MSAFTSIPRASVNGTGTGTSTEPLKTAPTPVEAASTPVTDAMAPQVQSFSGRTLIGSASRSVNALAPKGTKTRRAPASTPETFQAQLLETRKAAATLHAETAKKQATVVGEATNGAEAPGSFEAQLLEARQAAATHYAATHYAESQSATNNASTKVDESAEHPATRTKQLSQYIKASPALSFVVAHPATSFGIAIGVGAAAAAFTGAATVAGGILVAGLGIYLGLFVGARMAQGFSDVVKGSYASQEAKDMKSGIQKLAKDGWDSLPPLLRRKAPAEKGNESSPVDGNDSSDRKGNALPNLTATVSSDVRDENQS